MEGSSALPVSVSYTGSEGRMIAGSSREPGGGEPDPAPASAPPPAAAGAGEPGNPFGGPSAGGTISRDPMAAWAANINKKDSDSIFRLLPGGQEGKVRRARGRQGRAPGPGSEPPSCLLPACARR